MKRADTKIEHVEMTEVSRSMTIFNPHIVLRFPDKFPDSYLGLNQ
jgi:hypothetical protein